MTAVLQWVGRSSEVPTGGDDFDVRGGTDEEKALARKQSEMGREVIQTRSSDNVMTDLEITVVQAEGAGNIQTVMRIAYASNSIVEGQMEAEADRVKAGREILQ